MLQTLVSEGKIKYVGISEASPAEIRKAHSICPLTAVQIEYSLWSRDVEGGQCSGLPQKKRKTKFVDNCYVCAFVQDQPNQNS